MADGTILVVDDNRDAADTLDTLLHQLGYHSYTAYDGAAALDMVRKLQPDAVFLDLGLPDMDGFEVVRRLRAELPEPPPFIALTGYGHAESEQSTREAGFLDHLTKPLAAADLEAVLARLFA